MYARVTTIEAPSDRLDDVTCCVRGRFQLQQQGGFTGFLALTDCPSSHRLGLTLRESEKALRPTRKQGLSNGGSADATGATLAGVENCEVADFEVLS